MSTIAIAIQTKPSLPQLELDLEAAKLAGFEIKPFTCEPFTYNLIDFEPKASIVRGDTRSIEQIAKLHSNAIFYKEENFKQTITHAILGDTMLNYGSIFCSWDDLLKAGKWPIEDSYLFIRPNNDLKQFQGQVFDTLCFDPEGLFSHFETSGNTVNLDAIVCLSAAKNIDSEYRIIVVNKQVFHIARTHYKGHISPSPNYPSQILEFAETICKNWLPEDTVVFDLAYLNDFDIKIVEFNCWNASGFAELPAKERAAMFIRVHTSNKRRK